METSAFEFQNYGDARHKATTVFVEKYILISLFLAYSEVKVSGKALMYKLVCSAQIISCLNSQGKSQMFTL